MKYRQQKNRHGMKRIKLGMASINHLEHKDENTGLKYEGQVANGSMIQNMT